MAHRTATYTNFEDRFKALIGVDNITTDEQTIINNYFNLRMENLRNDYEWPADTTYGEMRHIGKNLITKSNDFSDALWTANDLTPTDDDTGSRDIDWGFNGASVVEVANTAVHTLEYTVNQTGQETAFEVYVKALNTANRAWVWLYTDGTNAPSAHFDLLNEVVGTTANVESATITEMWNGWYRLKMVHSAKDQVYPGTTYTIGFATGDDAGDDSYLGVATNGFRLNRARVYSTDEAFLEFAEEDKDTMEDIFEIWGSDPNLAAHPGAPLIKRITADGALILSDVDSAVWVWYRKDGTVFSTTGSQTFPAMFLEYLVRGCHADYTRGELGDHDRAGYPPSARFPNGTGLEALATDALFRALDRVENQEGQQVYTRFNNHQTIQNR
jgi:hypothetical protein